MFLDRDTIGGDGLNIHQSIPIHGIQEFGKIQIVSHTGNRERRALIQTWDTKKLIHTHNTLVAEIIKNGNISQNQKNILQSMEQEGLNVGGKFTGKIQENKGVQKISHLEGMSRYNPLQGNTDILRGETRLRMWSLL